jgi:hypothetical protein
MVGDLEYMAGDLEYMVLLIRAGKSESHKINISSAKI